MAREYPSSEAEFARISGVGQKKLAEYGTVFLQEIAAHLTNNPRQIFADDSLSAPRMMPAKAVLSDTAHQTLRRFRAGDSIDAIAASRGLTAGTIFGHLAEAVAGVSVARQAQPAAMSGLFKRTRVRANLNRIARQRQI